MTKLDLSLDITASSTSNTKEWIQKSRQRQEEEKLAKVQKSLRNRYDDDEEEDDENNGVSSDLRPSKRQKSSNVYTSKQLKGLQIMHGEKDFEVGHEVILTLADTSVLATDEDGKILGVNDEEAILENVNLAERERLAEAEKRRKRLKQPHYTGYDDAEFDENLPIGSKPSILSHYDKEKKKTAKLVIMDGRQISSNQGEEGNNDGSSKSTEEKNKEYLKRKYETLQMELKPASSYLSSDDIKFRKGLKTKKKSNIRKIVVDDNDNNDNNNHTTTAMETEERKKTSFDFDEEDPDLAQALSRARQLALQKRQQQQSSEMQIERLGANEAKEDDNADEGDDDIDKGAKIAREIALTAAKEAAKQTADQAQREDDLEDVDIEGRRTDGKLIFNSTTEFTTRLQARLNDNARSKAEAALRDMARQASLTSSSHHNPSVDISQGLSSSQKRGDQEEEMSVEPSIEHRSIGKSVGSQSKELRGEEEGKVEGEDHYDWEGLEEEEMSAGTASMSQEINDDQLAFLHRQPVISKGLAGALEMLRSSGELRKGNELAGRAKDDRTNDPSKDDKGVKLEYRDEFGRKLTQKEAFRQLSYKFHGYGPGKKNLEKRLKQIEIERKMVKARAGVLDGSAGTMKSLAKTQEATGKAHVVVQGGTAPSSLVSKIAADMVKKKQNSSSK